MSDNTAAVVGDLVVFLDLDDVVCLNDPVGGYDALETLAQMRKCCVPMDNYQKDVWDRLFDRTCVTNLCRIHNEFGPTWVISSSWRRFFNRDDLCEIFQASGLGFVADHLHVDWDTPVLKRKISQVQDDRAGEIANWLQGHPEVKEWFAIDDERSGTGFVLDVRQHMVARTVMCKVNAGFQHSEYLRLRDLLYEAS